MATHNKKILLFADEHGGPDQEVFRFGIVVCPATLAAKIDTHVVKNLPELAGEIHSSGWRDDTLVEILKNLKRHPESKYVTLLNYNCRRREKSHAETYMATLVEASRTALNQFKKIYNSVLSKKHENNSGVFINNVEMIIDRCQFNDSDAFNERFRAYLTHGHGRAITHFSALDSCASRLLQIADVVAYGDALIKNGCARKVLEDECGVIFA